MDFITENNRAGMGIRKGLLFSVLLHIGVLLLTFTITSTERPRMTFGPIHTVELVSLNSLPPARHPQNEDTRSFLPEPEMRHPAISLRKPIDVSPEPVLRRLEIDRKETPPLPKISDALKARATAPATPAKPSTAPVTAPQVALPQQMVSDAPKAQLPAGKTTPVGPAHTEMNAIMQAYYNQVWAAIRKQWTISSLFTPKGNISATVVISIAPSGAAQVVSFERRSGNNHFDESTLRAIKKASPFPPLPEWIQGGIEIGIRFHSEDLR